MKAINKIAAVLCLSIVASWALAAGTVNINTADAEALEALNGVGPAKAQAIVEHRNQHGPFESVEGLMAVKGVGDKVLHDNAELISVGGAE